VVMDWIELAQDTDRWRALVYAVMSCSRRTLIHVVSKYYSQAQNTTACQPNVLLSWVYQLLVMNTGRSISSVRTSAKDNCKLLSQCQYISTAWMWVMNLVSRVTLHRVQQPHFLRIG
jgi:hypothetical protein